MLIKVKAFPNSKEDKVVKKNEDSFDVFVEAEAERNMANKRIIELLAGYFNLPQAKVKMITSNGETAVIGGMRQMQESKQEQGIPILQDIPLLGQLFKYTKRETKKTDLIIFITPRIEAPMSTKVSPSE